MEKNGLAATPGALAAVPCAECDRLRKALDRAVSERNEALVLLAKARARSQDLYVTWAEAISAEGRRAPPPPPPPPLRHQLVDALVAKTKSRLPGAHAGARALGAFLLRRGKKS